MGEAGHPTVPLDFGNSGERGHTKDWQPNAAGKLIERVEGTTEGPIWAFQTVSKLDFSHLAL